MQRDFNGVKVEKRVLDNTEKTNDPGGGKWSLIICHPCLSPFFTFLISAENRGWYHNCQYSAVFPVIMCLYMLEENSHGEEGVHHCSRCSYSVNISLNVTKIAIIISLQGKSEIFKPINLPFPSTYSKLFLEVSSEISACHIICHFIKKDDFYLELSISNIIKYSRAL